MRYQVMGTGRVTRAVMSGVLLFAAVCVAGIAAEQPDVCAVKMSAPPKLDGKLDEAFWQKAESYGNFFLVKGEGKRTDATTFKVAHDDTWLYFGVRCDNDELHRFQPKFRSHDDPVHSDDSLELFLDPAGDGRVYFHYKLAFNNVSAEQIVRDGVKDTEWNVPWLSATAQDPKGWSAEIAIPLFLLASYGDLDKLTFNIARSERRIQALDGAKEILSEAQVAGTWRQILRGFHEPDRFAPLAGIKPGKLVVPFMASLDNARVLPYEIKEGAMGYNVEITVAPASDRAGELEAIVSDVTTDGVKGEARLPFRVSGTVPQTQTIHVPATSMVERDVTIVLRDPATGNELGRRVVARPESLRLMTAYLDRNYYTDEQVATVHVALGLPPENIKGMKLVARSGGKAVGEAAADSAAITFPIASWSNGTHAVTVDLRRGDGALFFSLPLALIKLPPKPGHEWKIDHVNQVILDNGKPFFGIDMVQPMVGHDAEMITRCVADYGFNTISMWSGITNYWIFQPGEYADYAELVNKYNLKLVSWTENARSHEPRGEYDWTHLQPYFKTLSPAQVEKEKAALTNWYLAGAVRFKGYLIFKAHGLDAAQRDAAFFEHYRYHRGPVLKGVEAVMNATNLVGYNLNDEPAVFQMAASEDLHARIHALDGYHPTFLLFSGTPPIGVEDRPMYDILAQDPYWTPGGTDPKRNSPRYVAAATADLHRRAGRTTRRAPIWINVSSEFFRGYRTYTVAEQECQAWLALINGATFVSYFHNIAHRETWDTLRKLNRFMAELAPALTAPAVNQSVAYRNGRIAAPGGAAAYEPGEFNTEKGMFPDVQAVLKRYPDGRSVLLAANCFDRPTRCEFRIPGLAGVASNLVTGAIQSVKDGAFTDEFKGYGIAAYFLDLPAAKDSIDLTVSSVVNAGDIRPDPLGLRNYVRPGKKNVLPNPSFEEATRPGYPDYFFMVPALMPDQLIGGEHARIGQVTNEVFHGAHSLMISRKPGLPAGGGDVMFYCQPQHDEKTLYTFSFYARTDTPGLRLFYRSEYGDKTFELTADWQRYTMPWEVPPKSEVERGRLEISPNNFGTVWLDAMQVEKGAKATDFEE